MTQSHDNKHSLTTSPNTRIKKTELRMMRKEEEEGKEKCALQKILPSGPKVFVRFESEDKSLIGVTSREKCH